MAKNKKKKQKKLSALLLLLFLSVVLLSTSTYAWFTANKNIKVDDINVNVAAQGGIQISTDAVNWKTVITNEDITGANGNYGTAKNQLPSALVATSTSGAVTGGFMDMFTGTVKSNSTGDFTLYAVKSNPESHGTSGNYIAFDMFIKSDNETDTTIVLEPGSGAITKVGDTSKGLEYATRIAFINEGNVAKSATPAQAQALVGGTTAVIYEPNFEGHTAYGVTQANNYYKKTIGADVTIAAGTGNAKINTDGVKAAITEAGAIKLIETNATDNPASFATQNTTGLEKNFVDAGAGSTAKTFTVLPGGITKFRVYMWIEGQDVDCENNASGSNITFKLAFSVAESQA